MAWLHLCASDTATGCVQPVQVAYLAAMLVGAIVLVIAARRASDLSTATLTLMPFAIAINIAVGSLIFVLRLPIYADSIGTVLVGVLAGPWAGALTGLLANLIWSILPVPGGSGAGPVAAFFAPVAAAIGLMAGFWGARGVFRLRSDDVAVGGFLALAFGVAAAAIAFLVIQQTIGLSFALDDPDSQNRFVTLGLVIVATGVVAAWASRRTIFRFGPGDEARIKSALTAATAVSAALLVFAILRLFFAPNGYFSTVDGLAQDGTPDPFLFGVDLSGLALQDPAGLIGVVAIALVVAGLAWWWASRGEHARLFPVWVAGLTTGIIAATIAAPIAAGVYGGVTGGGTDALVALYRTLGLSIFGSAFAQGLTSDPLDKTITFTIVFVILGAMPLTVRTLFSRGESSVRD